MIFLLYALPLWICSAYVAAQIGMSKNRPVGGVLYGLFFGIIGAFLMYLIPQRQEA